MEYNPLVSVCIITYNQEEYIEKCLQGAVNQNFKGNFEIVIGEDHSTDRTRDICKQFSRNYPDRIKLLERSENLGVMKNFISTLSCCQGKYIAICEGDDYWTDNSKLQKQFDIMEENINIDLSFHQCDILENTTVTPKIKSKIFPKYKHQDIIKLEDVLKGGGGLIPMASIFFRSSILEQYLSQVGKYSGGHYLLQVMGSLNGAIFLKYNMAVYRVNSSTSVIKNVKNNSAYYEIWIKNHIEKLEDFKEIAGMKYGDLIDSLIIKEKMNAFRSFKISKDYRIELYEELYKSNHLSQGDRIKFYLIYKNESLKKLVEKIYRLMKN